MLERSDDMAKKSKSLVPASISGGGRGAIPAVGGKGGTQAMPKGGKRGSASRMGRPKGY